MAELWRRRIVHQLVAAAAPNDAVTGQALAWQKAMTRWGVDGDVYAEHIHPDLAARVRPIAEFRDDPLAVTLLRYSIWSAVAERALGVARDRLALWYHNITPGALLSQANPQLASLCERGRRALPAVVAAASVAVADSSFNGAELQAAGADRVAVVPLLLDVPDAPQPPRGAPQPIVLTVGRVVPNKRIEDGVRALALLRRHHLPDARLVVVGSWGGFERYRTALEDFARRLDVADAVLFTGQVGDDERDHWYREAGAYICTSEHEGFCAPLVEALAHGLPVVARAAGAVPETVGSAGLLLPGPDATLFAEALSAVLTDAEIRKLLGANAQVRLVQLAPRRVEELGRSALEPLLR